MDKNISPYKLIYNSSQLIDLISEWKRKKEKIVFTNGCFDILHRGHVEYIYKAAQYGDRLIVGLNSDSSVKRLKGETRPINDEMARALVLASLRVVDAVCLFEEDTPIKLIEVVNPDILIKGGDYKVENIVGYQHLISYGGKVITIPFIEGYSSTKIIENL